MMTLAPLQETLCTYIIAISAQAHSMQKNIFAFVEFETSAALNCFSPPSLNAEKQEPLLAEPPLRHQPLPPAVGGRTERVQQRSLEGAARFGTKKKILAFL